MKVTKSILALCVAAVAFASCSNNENELSNAPKQVALTLNLPELGSTRAVGPETTTGAVATFSGDVIITARVGQGGAVTNTITQTITPGTPATLTVSGAATWIDVVANDDDATVTPAVTGNVNSRQGIATSDAVRLIGGAAIVPGVAPANATCAVIIAPEMARVELTGVLGATTNISNLKIRGVYVNNIYLNRGATTLTKVASAAWTTNYVAGGAFEKMYSPFATPVTTFGTGNADGYNIFPQKDMTSPVTKEDVAAKSVHVALEVEYNLSDGTPASGWLNVVALKNAAAYVTNFEAAKVYAISLADISNVMDEIIPPVTPTPDPDLVSVDLTVTVAAWTVVQVTPEV